MSTARPVIHAKGCYCEGCRPTKVSRAPAAPPPQRPLFTRKGLPAAAAMKVASRPPSPSAPEPPPPPPGPTVFEVTAAREAELERARKRADSDARLARFLALRAAGVRRDEAQRQVDAEFPPEPPPPPPERTTP